MTFEYRVAAKIKKKAESLLRLVFRYVKSSYSAQQHPAPSAKIKVKIRFAGDDHLLFLLVIHILHSTLCQHCFMRGRRHSVLRRGESQFHVQLRGRQPEAIPSSVGRASCPSSFPRTRESSTSRDAGAYDLVAAGGPPMGSRSLRNAEFRSCCDSMARVLGLVHYWAGRAGAL
jgi:hypothetical protein